jgi:adenylylsulfate reductase subunit B
VYTVTKKRVSLHGASSSVTAKKDMDLLAPITTKPWGTCIPELASESAPAQDMRDGELLFNEPKYIRMDEGGLHTLESNGLKMKEGVYY